ncbi:MAG: UDP-N-acetylmuramate--L-alanine ligase [Lachnospiraceae bacterium]|nr:UDP-N-acetylmuramate--L-alanine ligase [Lachnospiraceae bacterium]
MFQINYDSPANLYFIGIGGISMSAFAELLCSKGFHIKGSDSHESAITRHLESLGIDVFYGQKADNIPGDTDLVVYTAAISEDNPEYAEAVRRGLPMMVRAEMIGQIMKNYDNTIAVSGTHGKTTATSILTYIYMAAELDPTVSVGCILDILNGNLRIGHSQNWIMEACEYTNSFFHFNPSTAIILNVEEDHLDFFKDINDIRNSFHLFAKKIPDDGLLVIDRDIEQYETITDGLTCSILTYSITDSSADFYADNINFNENGFGMFDLYINGKYAEHFELSVVGKHNISNSLAAICVAYAQKVDINAIKTGLLSFRGADRRFQKKGVINGITVIDDYAHHPSEINATLDAAKNYPHNRIVCVFQPHTYTRTKNFLKDFARSLSKADMVIVTDIYAAREKDTGEISSKDLYNELKKRNAEVYYISSFDDIKNFILENCINGDMLITMGAGDIVSVGESLLGQ